MPVYVMCPSRLFRMYTYGMSYPPRVDELRESRRAPEYEILKY